MYLHLEPDDGACCTETGSALILAFIVNILNCPTEVHGIITTKILVAAIIWIKI